jgi:ABC-type polysaccharide/polyol phosphate export permease
MPTTIYEPNQRIKIGFFKSWLSMVTNILKSRELIWQLFRRDFFAGCEQSFPGIFRVFISPVVGIIFLSLALMVSCTGPFG